MFDFTTKSVYVGTGKKQEKKRKKIKGNTGDGRKKADVD